MNPGQNLHTSTFTSLKTTDIQGNQPLFNTGQRFNQGQLVQTGNSNFQMPQSNWNNVVMGAITGAGEGFVGGIENVIDGLTQGEYSRRIDANFDNAYTNRQNQLQSQADMSGLGNVNRLANTVIGASSRLMPFAYGLGRFMVK